MPTTNPYEASSEHESLKNAWDWGYQYGHDHPGETDPTPQMSLAQEEEVAWREGALAGKTDTLDKVDVPVHVHKEHESENVLPDVAVHGGAHAVISAGEVVFGEATVGAAAASTVFAVVFALLFATHAEAPDQKSVDRKELTQWFSERCSTMGCTDLYMGCCPPGGCGDPSAHHGDDAIFEVGMWHGHLYKDDLASAWAEAKSHLEASATWKSPATWQPRRVEDVIYFHTGIWHLKASAPDTLEFAQILKNG